jgi:N-acylglucosamine-6-phosphate 2-epimerase
MTNNEILDKLKGKLIVSCQALECEPLHSSFIMGRMAVAAKEGGASGIRANTIEDIKEIKSLVDLPLIGIIKKDYNDSEIYITPTIDEVEKLINSEAEIIALDATNRKRPGGEKVEDLIAKIKAAGKLAMADIATFEEGVNAETLGFDIVSTTLSGYTKQSQGRPAPDFELIEKLSKAVNIPIIAEGHIQTPQELVKALSCGAHCAVIGSIITRPQLITKYFVDAIK